MRLLRNSKQSNHTTPSPESQWHEPRGSKIRDPGQRDREVKVAPNRGVDVVSDIGDVVEHAVDRRAHDGLMVEETHEGAAQADIEDEGGVGVVFGSFFIVDYCLQELVVLGLVIDAGFEPEFIVGDGIDVEAGDDTW